MKKLKAWLSQDPFAKEGLAILIVGVASMPFVIQRFQSM
jgi:hypothetical protein